MSRVSRRQNDDYYFQFIPEKWLSDGGLARCSFAAKGLWIDMLVRMHFENPRGVLDGNLDELASLLGKDVAVIEPLIDELERRKVFSRGREIDPGELADDAIVNRFMFRKNRLSQVRAEAGSKGGKARAEKQGSDGGENGSENAVTGWGVTHANTVDENPDESVSRIKQNASKSKQNDMGQVIAGHRDDFGSAKQNRSITRVIAITKDRSKPNNAITSVGDVLGGALKSRGVDESMATSSKDSSEKTSWVKPSTKQLRQLVDRCAVITGSDKSNGNWWKLTNAMSENESAFDAMLSEVVEFEDELSRRDPLRVRPKNPGAILNKRLRDACRRCGVKLEVA